MKIKEDDYRLSMAANVLIAIMNTARFWLLWPLDWKKKKPCPAMRWIQLFKNSKLNKDG